MATYDELKRQAEQARANGQKPFSGPQYAAADSVTRNLMDKIANS